MSYQFTLVQKGLVLVIVPMAFVLILAMVLLHLSGEMERVAVQASQSRKLRALVNDFVKQLYDAIKAVRLKNDSNGNFYDRDVHIKEAIILLDKLRHNLAHDEKKLRLVNDLQRHLIMENEVVDKARKAVDAGNLDEFERLGKLSHENMRRITDGEILAIGDEQTEVVERSPVLASEFRNQIRASLLAAVAGSIAITLILVLVINRGLVSRLQAIARNASLLEEGRPLLPMLGGTDEIACLDRRFHQMAEALEESRRREQAIVDSSIDVICSIGRTGALDNVSRSSSTMLGYAPAELISHDYTSILARDFVIPTVAAFDEIVAGKLQAFETRFVRKDGEVVDVLWSGQWSNAEQSMFVVLHDVTERLKAQRIKQQVIGMVTHDLKTPLTTISHIHEMLNDGMLGELSEDNLASVNEADCAGKKMLQLINDLLDLEKIEAGMLELHPRRFELNEVVENCLIAVSAPANCRSVRIQRGSIGASMYGDPHRIGQALLKVVEYMIDVASPATEVLIEAEQKSETVEIRIRDHSDALTSEAQESIFQPFGQDVYKQSTQDANVGSGLGLALARAIVELHGGRIDIAAVQGEGNTFTFTIASAQPDLIS